MRLTLVVAALAALATTTTAPAYAQYEHAHGPGYHGPRYYGQAHRTRMFRGAYNRAPMIEPLFTSGGWVPEPIFDHSRIGGIDPNINPPPN